MTRTAKFQRALGLSALTFGLLASATSFAQLIEIEDPASQNTNQVAEETQMDAQSGAVSSTLQTAPVTISSGMAPRLAPQAEIPAPMTGIGGNNPGNANTGGVQVQSVNVTAVQDQTTANGRADIIRRERMRRELENETRLIEKVEEGRLEDETRRAKIIEDFQSRAEIENQQVIVAPVAPVLAASPAPYVGDTTVTVSRRSVGLEDSGFALKPFGGYRWYNRQELYALDPDNMITTGVALEGRVNSYLGIEGNFTFAHDRFQVRNVVAGAPLGVGPVAGGGMFLGQGPVAQTGAVNGGFAGMCNGFNGMGCNFRTRDSYEISAAAKIGMPIGMVRPYALAGLGGIYSNYNIDNAATTAYANSIGWVRNTRHFMGVFGGGLDVNTSRYLAIGARFDYQSVMGGEATAMHQIYGSAADRFQITGNLSLQF